MYKIINACLHYAIYLSLNKSIIYRKTSLIHSLTFPVIAKLLSTFKVCVMSKISKIILVHQIIVNHNPA